MLELSKISQIEKVGLEVTVNVITVFTDSTLLGIEFHIVDSATTKMPRVDICFLGMKRRIR